MPIPRERDPDLRWALPLIAGITLLAALLRFPFLAAEDLWFDEIVSAVLSTQDLGELLRAALADQTNPPGFYLALWGWVQLGSVDPAWLRALPALAGTLTAPAVAALARALGMRWREALVAALLAAVSPLLLAMSLELRAYAPLALCTALALALASRLAGPGTPSRRLVIGLATAELALVSLHYFGALVVGVAVAATWWTRRDRARTACLAALPAALALTAWIGLVVKDAADRGVGRNASWIPAPHLAALPSFASEVIGTFGTGWGAVGVSAVLLASLLVTAWRAQMTIRADAAGDATRARARWLLATAVAPLVIVFAVSTLGPRSLWVSRYLIIALPPLWVLVADAAGSLPREARAVGLIVLAAWAGLAGPLAERARVHKPAWSLVVRALTGGAPATVCVNESFLGLTLEYHAAEQRVPLRVLEFPQCASERRGRWALIRPETDGSLEFLASRGAALGPPRHLHTALPDADLRTMRWLPR